MNIAVNEWQIMQELWRQCPLTLKQLCDSVGKRNSWTKHNVISTLKRLESKECIRVEQTDERKYFYPTVDEQEAVKQETEQFAQKAYGGNKMLLVSSIVREEELSDAEIEELMSILNDRRR